MNEANEDLYRQLVSAGVSDAGPSNDLRERVLSASAAAFPARRPGRWAVAWQRKSVRYGVLAATFAIVMFGGVNLLPLGQEGAAGAEWWLGPPAVWAAEIVAELDKVEAVTCRERTEIVMPDGARHMSSTVDKFYVGRDSYRRDIYDGETLREIQWYVPDGGDMIQTGVRFDLRCYSAVRHRGGFGNQDPVSRLRFHVLLIDKANRLLGTKTIEHRECVGFEIGASQYGSNPPEWFDRIWFDVETRLPVRVEQHKRPVTGDDSRTFTVIQNRFDYDADVPADTFVPKIPAGFVNAHPDELESAGQGAGTSVGSE